VRAIFLDRDGVINIYRSDYVRSEADFVYYDHTPEAFRVLGALGLPLIVITNQSGIARGYQSEQEVRLLGDRLVADARDWGAEIVSIEYCPHLPDAGCECRKPARGLFDRAAVAHKLRFDGSYMVGDSPADMRAGRDLGLVTVRVSTGRGAEGDGVDDDYRESDFLGAARRIADLERCRAGSESSSR